MSIWWRTKPIERLLAEQADGKSQLKRTMGPLDLTALGVGAIIGTGIFVLTGVAAAKYAGPGIIFSFIVAGLASVFAALVYAELASMIPVAGSTYTYAYASLGEVVAWGIGWNLILEYMVAAGAVAIGWSSYFTDLLHSIGLSLPRAFTVSPFYGGIFNLPAAFIALLITFLIITGTQHSAIANKIIVALKLGAILLFIALGIRHIDPANWHPLLPYGFEGIMRGAAIIFFAYIGFDAVSTAAEEVRNPKRDLPIGIVASLVISTLLYISVSIILTGMARYTTLDNASPVASALLRAGIRWGSALVSVGALAGLTSVLLVNMYGQSRIFFAMARDGLLPPIFFRVHPKYRTPYLDSLIIGVVVALIGALMPIGTVAELANIGTLSAFIVVSIGVLVLRRAKPDLPRPFRTPLMPVTPLLAIAFAVYLIFNLPPLTWIRFFVWLALGLAIYFLYSRHHSRLVTGKDDENPTPTWWPSPAVLQKPLEEGQSNEKETGQEK